MPKLTLVSDTPEEVLAEQKRAAAEQRRQHALEDCRFAIRDLTANLLRITRGAGKPHEIGEQLKYLADAIADHREAVGHGPRWDDITAELTVRDTEREARVRHEHQRTVIAEDLMIRGAFQVAASRLLGQSTQETRGHYEMIDGFNALTMARQADKAAWAAERRAKTKTEIMDGVLAEVRKKSPKRPARTPRK